MLSLVLHGHFYQPPRENPFLDFVEMEESAAPFHDWNQRIERECYRAVTAARLTGRGGRITRIVNTLEWISFDVGPTLLEWLEREAPSTYAALLYADRASAARLDGHGNAIAQPYHHTILPLASRRDKVTEVRWGIADFRRRFGREPEGMWLPETAVDDETLDVLAEHGIRFTIVAPHQVVNPPPRGLPGRYRTRAGRQIALCVYDGGLSHRIAFGGALHDAMAWVASMRSFADASDGERVLAAATDGETYGHHHKFGEMALARAIEEMRRAGARIENFAALLARTGVPATNVELVEPTSWSCAHGVERWRADCGCRMDPANGWSQAWRAPLRTALEHLARGLHEVYARDAVHFMDDPWAARDAYGAVVGTVDDERRRRCVERLAREPRDAGQLVRVRELLEMERDALRMFTSCAWFFDDVAGIEARQVLRYAAHAIALAGADGPRLESEFLDLLVRAVSNDATQGTARDVYLRYAKPTMPAPARIAAAAFAMAAVDLAPPRHRFPVAEVEVAGSRVRVVSRRTGRTSEYRARLLRRTATAVDVELIEADETRRVVTLADFPERSREAIRGLLLRALLPQALTTDELDALLAGTATLPGLLRVALIRSIERLADDASPEAEQLARDLLDRFAQFDAKVPFDAQTAFWRVWHKLSTERRERLIGIGEQLGFAMEEWDR